LILFVDSGVADRPSLGIDLSVPGVISPDAEAPALRLEAHGSMGAIRDVVSALNERGVLVISHGNRGIRMVLHRDIDDEAVTQVVNVFRNLP
jgi:hypothetical protein